MSDLTTKARNTATAQRNESVLDLLERQRPEIDRQLAGTMHTDAFLRAVVTQTKAAPMLLQATPTSFLGSVMLAAQLHLEIGPALGQFYLTPRKMDRGKDTERVECVPIIGYQGYVELGYRSGRVKSVGSLLVREGDFFEYGFDQDRGEFCTWIPKDTREDRPWTHVIAYARTTTGGVAYSRLTKEQVFDRRPSHWQDTPWKYKEEPMVLKTGLRALAPKMPKSIELGKALEADEKTVTAVAGEDDLVIEGETVGGEKQ